MNVISNATRPVPSEALAAWLAAQDDDLFISSMTVAEIDELRLLRFQRRAGALLGARLDRVGCGRLERRADGDQPDSEQGAHHEQELEQRERGGGLAVSEKNASGRHGSCPRILGASR